MSCPFNNKFPWIHLNETGKKYPGLGLARLSSREPHPYHKNATHGLTWVPLHVRENTKRYEGRQRHVHLKEITNNITHHIQECLLKGKWLSCIMDLSLETPGHCPGFIMKLCQDWPEPVNLFTRELLSSYLSESMSPFTTRSVPQSRTLLDSPIQASPLAKNPFQTSNWT